MTIETKIMNAKNASMKLARVSEKTKNACLKLMGNALDANREKILIANKKDIADMEISHSKALIERLKVDDKKIDGMIAGINDVIKLKDPIGDTIDAIELDNGLELYQVSCPIGLIGVIFESRPDVVPQIMALCLKSGNAVVFKGGKEAKNSNQMIFDILTNSIKEIEEVSNDAFLILETREEVKNILNFDKYIDLLIPRGSNEFVKYIQNNTKIPVLGHADGICHVFVDEFADLKKALDICFDSKVQYPAVCNAMETLLIHKNIANTFLEDIVEKYNSVNVKMYFDDKSYKLIKSEKIPKHHATEENWVTEYNDMIISIKIVDSIDAAIDHINKYGSHHTDSIVTESKENKKLFIDLIDSSSVIINASTRFADGFRYGKGAEIGISTNKIHARGPVGMEGLLIYKYILIGNGDKVSDYADGKKIFTHKKLDKKFPLVYS